MRHLHLVVAEVGEDDALRRLAEGGRLPMLRRLLRRGRPAPPAAHLSGALGRAFGLDASLPIAPYTLALDGLEPGEQWWLRLDPVSLQVNLDHLSLVAAQPGLAEDEASALLDTLQRHFADDRLTFLAPTPERWYLAVHPPIDFVTHPPEAALGRRIDPFLPQGPHARRWLGLINEVQMLWHEHPVNLAREARGLPPVNSLWPWGQGRHAPLAAPAYDLVAARHPTALALGRAAALPVSAVDALDQLDPTAQAALAVLEPPPPGEEVPWLERLERSWLRPALQRLQSGGLSALRLELAGQAGTCVSLSAWDAWKLWR